MADDITDAWFKFAEQCNADPGYPQSHQASLDRGELEERSDRECPGLELPQVLWSNPLGRYELTGLSVAKK